MVMIMTMMLKIQKVILFKLIRDNSNNTTKYHSKSIASFSTHLAAGED